MRNPTYLLLLLLLIGLITGSHAQNWKQLGADIDGEGAGDTGSSLSFSSDGSIVAIGAASNDGNGSGSGHVRVYQNIAGTWTQIGDDIDGEAAGDLSGTSVSISSDGTIVAIGAQSNNGNGSYAGHVRIYENIAGTWTQVGADIDGEAASDRCGISVDLSSDGTIVAVGAYLNGGNGPIAGHVRVFQNIADTWTQIGSDIDGEATGDRSGKSVSLNSDGSIVAIGGYGNDGNGADAGHVRVYQNIAGTWTQIGADIDGEAAGDEMGHSVCLNSDGSIVAVGAVFNDGTGTDAGHVKIYQNVAGTWTQIGSDIDGEAANDEFGMSVSLSSDGSIVAIGAHKNDGTGNDAGHVRIYQNIADSWTQLGDDIDGEAEGDWSGFDVDLTSDGTAIAIRAYFNDGNGNGAGHVRVYGLSPVITTQPVNKTDICPGSEVILAIKGDFINAYKWQVSDDLGNNWSDIADNTTYSGSSTDSLKIATNYSQNNYQYRCYLENFGGHTISDTITLSFEAEDPVITSNHGNKTIEANSNCAASLPDYTGSVTATDNCDLDLNVTQMPIAGTTISGAINQVKLTVCDNAGNEAEVSFNIEVIDKTNPVISSTHGNQAVEADINCETSLPDYTGSITATDNCDENISVTQVPIAGTTISGTSNQVKITVSDDDKNETEISFIVEVADHINPSFTCVNHSVVDADETNTFTVSGTEFDPDNINDNCDVNSILNDFNGATTLAGASFPIGTTTIVWIVLDKAGNQSVCSHDISVNSSTKIMPVNEIGISVYPNPIDDIIEINFGNSKKVYKVSIIDISGTKIIERRHIAKNEKIDISNFNSGIYVIVFETDNKIYTSKIIKR